MAPNVDALNDAISQIGAQWVAQPNPVVEEDDSLTIIRLGVIYDEEAQEEVAALFAQPPDMSGALAMYMERAPGLGDGDMLAGGSGGSGTATTTEVPTAVDWRDYRGMLAVTGVQDQGHCGSCVAFGTTATLESMLIIDHEVWMDLSEAELLWCGGGSCNGWWPSRALDYLLNRGVAQENCSPYSPDLTECQVCSRRDAQAIQISEQQVAVGFDDRRKFLATVGPMVAVMDVYDDFQAYSSGVYSHVTGDFLGRHCIQAVGYDDGNSCWICKNSWGQDWGESGFFRIAYGECGVDSNYPFWGMIQTRFYRP